MVTDSAQAVEQPASVAAIESVGPVDQVQPYLGDLSTPPPERGPDRIAVLKVLSVEEELCTGAGARTLQLEGIWGEGAGTKVEIGGHGFAGLATLEPGDVVVELRAVSGQPREFVEVESLEVAMFAVEGSALVEGQTNHAAPHETLSDCHAFRRIP